MRDILIYIFEMLICGGIFTLFYQLLLSKRASLTFCRIYLTGSMIASAVIPTLRIPVYPAEVVYYTPFAAVSVGDYTIQEIATGQDYVPLVLTVVYASVTAFALIMLLIQIIKIRSFRRGALIERTELYSLYENTRVKSPFSFFRNIFIPGGYEKIDLAQIVSHEVSHIRRKHSAELVVIEILKTLMWFNPFIWISRRNLVEVHEYQADRDVLEMGYDPEEYRKLIFKQFCGCTPDVANGFANSLIKKRFIMMTRKKKSRYALLKTAAVIPVVGAMLTLFSFTKQETVYVAQAQNDRNEEIAVPPVPVRKITVTGYAPSNSDGQISGSEHGGRGNIVEGRPAEFIDPNNLGGDAPPVYLWTAT